MARKLLMLMILAAGAIAILPQTSYAAWGASVSYSDRGGHGGGRHHYYRYHDHPHWGVKVSYVEPRYRILVGRSRYYYYDGIYYAPAGREYVVVAPPVGAVVATVPGDYRSVVVNGVVYYTDNGTYYMRTPSGYQVVAPPTQVVAMPVAPAPVVETASVEPGEFAVNVPNNGGGYTAVTIRRSGSGFVGPQGEYYSEFPTVARLKVAYGK